MAQQASLNNHFISPSSEKAESKAVQEVTTKEFGFIPIPQWLRYGPERPPRFSLLLNSVFGFGCTFLIANLNYTQPLLIHLSQSFDVSYDEISRIPTLAQGGYAVGLVLISPLGDLVPRRQLVLLLVTMTTLLTIGLAVTKSLVAFEILNFLVGVFSVAPSIFVSLAADLAPPHRKATAISIVLSGLLLGILLARVLAGIIGDFTTWRVVYYMAIGAQALVLSTCYLMIPDYPAKNAGLTYFDILWSMAKFAVMEPALIQGLLITIGSSACFQSFWVTLTFLLGNSPYNYSTLVIGLFGLIGIAAVLLSPLAGRMIDKFFPWYAALVSLLLLLCAQAIQTAAGGISITAVIIATIGLDFFRQLTQVAVSTSVMVIHPPASSRMNSLIILAFFIGSVMGTSVGTKVFVEHGWRAASGVNMAWYGFQLAVLLVRGPHCNRYTWFGYEGGLKARRPVVAHKGQVAV